MPPAELLGRGRAEVERYGGSVVSVGVAAARRGTEGFVVERVDAVAVAARRLLVTTGLVDDAGPGAVPAHGDRACGRAARAARSPRDGRRARPGHRAGGDW